MKPPRKILVLNMAGSQKDFLIVGESKSGVEDSAEVGSWCS
jgi:hypothetical protein